MGTHARRPRTGRIAVALAGLTLLAAPSAHAATNEIYDFNLSETTSTYGSFTATTGGGVSYRWLDSPVRATVISSANCFNNATIGSATYSAGSTSYQSIGSPSNGTCFLLRGRTTAGSGNMFYYDGRLSR
jgi:hypothetical protein